MEIVHLTGMDPLLFTLIGPLAMNPKVLKANNNYPFKTTEHFQWYIGLENENQVVGFVPIEHKGHTLVINNYYVPNDDLEILKQLLRAIVPQEGLNAVVQTKHESAFTECGFQTEHRWTNYIKMTYKTDEKDE